MGHTVTRLGHVYRHHLARIALPFAVAVGARLVAINQISWWRAWRVTGSLNDVSVFGALIMVGLFRMLSMLMLTMMTKMRLLRKRCFRRRPPALPPLLLRLWGCRFRAPSIIRHITEFAQYP